MMVFFSCGVAISVASVTVAVDAVAGAHFVSV